MAIKHLPGFTDKEIKKKNPDVPIWKRREVLLSPLVIFVGLGYGLFGITVAIIWILKWILFSWMAPFVEWKWLCKIGLHKYRLQSNGMHGRLYKCKICKNDMIVSND